MKEPTTMAGPSISAEQYYAIIRAQIEHEDELISQRLSWFVASQAFLFTAYAIVVSNLPSAKAHWSEQQLQRLLIVLPVTAILTCILIYAAVIAGLLAIRNLHRLYRSYFGLAGDMGFPPVQGYRRTQLLGQAAPVLMPLLFVAVWFWLLVRGMA